MFRHVIYAIFFWQQLNKTADCFNNFVFILVAIISSKKVCEKMENDSTLEKVLLRATFDSKVASPRRIRKKNFIILKSLQKQKFAIFCFICMSLLTFELSNINWKYSENCNMLSERTYDSAVFKFFLNFKTIWIFNWAIINGNFIWNIDLNNGVSCDLRNKSACLNMV